MSDWIEHNGGPQPVADGTWVVMDKVGFGSGFATAWQPAWLNWNKPNSYRIINQHLIDAARLEGIRLGLEAAAKAADAYDNLAAKAIQRLNPETIAKETQHD